MIGAVSDAAKEQLALSQFWKPTEIHDYKVHFARRNAEEQPLSVLSRSMEDWQKWQEFYPNRNDFNRRYIFSLAQIADAEDLWMFGGIWEVHGLDGMLEGGRRYRVSLSNELEPLIGRMKLHRMHRLRTTRANLESHYDHFIVEEILPSRYTGRAFPGYDSVHLSFRELETLMRAGRQDWAAALGHVNGVYLITDTNSQRRYVGSAYGADGIWSRWGAYIAGGDGGNEGMRELLGDRGIDYCRKYFKFALLEHHDARTPKCEVIVRENYWKEVLDTRQMDTGLNRN